MDYSRCQEGHYDLQGVGPVDLGLGVNGHARNVVLYLGDKMEVP